MGGCNKLAKICIMTKDLRKENVGMWSKTHVKLPNVEIMYWKLSLQIRRNELR